MENVRQTLQALDLNGDGILTVEEVLHTLDNKKEVEWNLDLMALLTDFADAENKVEIDKVVQFFGFMEDFSTCEGPKQGKKVMLQFLRFIDDNGDGNLSKNEAQSGFEKMKMWQDIKGIFVDLENDKGKVSIKGISLQLDEFFANFLFIFFHPTLITKFFAAFMTRLEENWQ